MTYVQKLQQLNKLIKDQISMIQKGGKLSTFHRDQKPRQKQLKKELMSQIKAIANANEIDIDVWIEIRNYITVLIRQLLDSYNLKYKDATKTFDDEKEVILQYMVYFDKAPFTLQRICQVILEPEKYYKSCKKILYAFEKLVNVSDPDER